MRAYRVVLPRADEDLASALLFEAGTVGIESQHDEADPEARLVAYFEGDVAPAEALAGLAGARVDEVGVPDVDWVARFRMGFSPFRVGRFLVAPAWDPPPEARDVLLVDPGRAFGTGTHETTRLCLAALEAIVARGGGLGRVLDVGCGTGLLALAAVRLGAPLALASDLDPEAVASARAHMLLNRARVHVVRADGGRPFRLHAFETLLANLTTPLLVERADELIALLAPGGRLVLAGLLAEDAGPVEAAYAVCGPAEVLVEGEWAGLVFTKGPA